MSDLKPCPFCGGEASHNGGGGSVLGRFWWTVGCKTCDFWLSDKEVWSQTDHGMLDPAYPPKHCFALWNKRAAVNHREEVMPDDARTSRPAHDIGPGDQGATAGAAWDAIFYGLGLTLDGQQIPVREFYAFPQGLFRLRGDTLGLRCATTGCGQHVSVRLERYGICIDYCEPCGLRAARK